MGFSRPSSGGPPLDWLMPRPIDPPAGQSAAGVLSSSPERPSAPPPPFLRPGVTPSARPAAGRARRITAVRAGGVTVMRGEAQWEGSRSAEGGAEEEEKGGEEGRAGQSEERGGKAGAREPTNGQGASGWALDGGYKVARGGRGQDFPPRMSASQESR